MEGVKAFKMGSKMYGIHSPFLFHASRVKSSLRVYVVGLDMSHNLPTFRAIALPEPPVGETQGNESLSVVLRVVQTPETTYL